MLIERVKQLCGGEIPENVNGKFFQISNGYVFVKTSIISRDFQNVIDNPESYDHDDFIGEYEVIQGIYIDFKNNLKEIRPGSSCYVKIYEEVDDCEKPKRHMDEYLNTEIEHINKLKSWIK